VGSESVGGAHPPLPLSESNIDFEDTKLTEQANDYGFSTPTARNGVALPSDSLSKESARMFEKMVQQRSVTNTSMVNTTTSKETAAAETGVSANAVGDGISFMISLGTYCGMIVACFLFFSCARLSYSKAYLNNSKTRLLPSSTFFGWIGDSLKLTTPQVIQIAGIDHAMLLDYSVLCMKILTVIGLPLVLIEIPLNIFAGGNAAGQDHLSWQGMANVKDGGPIYWFYAALVWWVVLMTQIMIFGAMHRFVRLRFQWASEMGPPQNTSIMVDNIPREIASTDAELMTYFNDVFKADAVVAAVLVKDTRETLLPAWQKLKQDRMALDDANEQFKKTGERPSAEITRLQQEIVDNERVINEARKRIETDSLVPGNSTTSLCGFVTFRLPSQAAAALTFDYSEDGDYFIVEVAPEPEDVIYSDLLVEPMRARINELIGYGILTVYFFGFLPVILFISMVTELATVEKYIPGLASLVKKAPAIAEIWDALFGSLALTIVMSFLPSLIALVFTSFFVLRSEGNCQYKMQAVYFFFLVMFVLLVTAIGSSLVSTLKEIANSPFTIFPLLANSLPTSSHFYLNYVLTQSGTQAMNLTRYINLIKFLIFRRSSSDENARLKAEPEDPDYYGMGSRSARFTLIMVICLTFCTLSPLIVILGVFFFALCRLIFGYLFVYSEDIKPDLGGAFYVRALYHTQFGLGLYIILMCGVLYERASNEFPGLVALAAMIPLIWSVLRFERRFKWDRLPNDYLQLTAGKEFNKRVCDRSNYVQPELGDPVNPSAPIDISFSSMGFNAMSFNIPNQESISNTIASTFSSTMASFRGQSKPDARELQPVV